MSSAKTYIANVRRCIPVENAALKVFSKTLGRELDRTSATKAHAKARKAYLKRLGSCRRLIERVRGRG